MSFDISPMLISCKLAAFTTVLLFFLAFGPAYYLARSGGRIKPVIETLLTLPLVLPPTVLGFYLLMLLSPVHYPGRLLKELFDLQLVFNFSGMTLAALVYSFPFMVRSLKDGLESVDPALIEASATLGKSFGETLVRVVLPAARGGIYTALSTTFAHTMGCFGVVLMIGGNIPGVTRTASIAVYEKVETMDYAGANLYALVLIGVSFTVLGVAGLFKHLPDRKRRMAANPSSLSDIRLRD